MKKKYIKPEFVPYIITTEPPETVGNYCDKNGRIYNSTTKDITIQYTIRPDIINDDSSVVAVLDKEEQENILSKLR